MGHKKLQRFSEMETFPNVLQYPENMKGNWCGFFNNEHPITLELACGKGEYAVGLGRMHPDQNFIGIDVKGNRIWVGAKTALRETLQNVAFLRTQIDRIAEYFSKDEVRNIWITFPDPQLRSSKLKKRLTHPKFLRLYRQFLKPDGFIHLKTDSPVLYHFTKKVIQLYDLPLHADTADLYAQASLTPDLMIQTHYEGLDIAGSNKIHYLKFSIGNSGLDLSKDLLLKEWVFETEPSFPEKNQVPDANNTGSDRLL
jgi:tRNA (guanine-N7-)-methyltransferase